MTTTWTAAELERFDKARTRVVECVNELVDDGFTGMEIYVALAERCSAILIEGVPDMAARTEFVDMFRARTIRPDA